MCKFIFSESLFPKRYKVVMMTTTMTFLMRQGQNRIQSAQLVSSRLFKSNSYRARKGRRNRLRDSYRGYEQFDQILQNFTIVDSDDEVVVVVMMTTMTLLMGQNRSKAKREIFSFFKDFKKKFETMVEKTVLLSNGESMPVLGLGTWRTNEEKGEEAIQVALETGYRHIDTAYAYQSEEGIGRALKLAFETGLVKREDLFIVTKLPNNGHRREKVEYFLKKSLSRLQLDYVDLYLIHFPFYVKGKHDDDFFPTENGRLVVDTETDHLQTWKGMEDVVDAGLAKAIGLSNFNSEQIQRIYNNSRIKPANLQVECHAYFAQRPLFEFCKKLNISFTAYAPLGSPGFKDFLKENHNIDLKDFPMLLEDPVLKPIAAKHDKKPSQVLLRWLIQRGMIVIPKSISPERIRENFQVFDFELTPEDMSTIDGLDKGKRIFEYSSYKGMTSHPDYPGSIPF